MACPQLELIPVLMSLLPVVVGGLIGLAGAFGANLLTHSLKTREQRSARSADKLEELMEAIFKYRDQFDQMRHHLVFGGEKPEFDLSVARIRGISALYFPELREKLHSMELVADQYQLAMFSAAQERLSEGAPSQKALDAITAAYQPFAAALISLVADVENHAKQIGLSRGTS